MSKLYQGLCPDWSITEEEYKKHNKPLPSKDNPEPLPYDDAWDWMIDHLVEKYSKKA